ncbi:MAG: 50S ribosomal protein L10 [Candidatus Uhrbacteria bacterium]|nr:50S ribosomal protein L10 [Candidatus Uhrbacteria bacterium]
MARTRKSKEDILDRLEDRIAKSTSVVFANVKGLKVKQIETLRSNLRKEDMECVVVKKTLLARAFSDAGISSFDFKGLEGEVATVFSFADQVAPARVLTAMAKQYEPLGILAGLLRDASTGDHVLSSVQIRALALLPSRDELRAKVVGTLAAPMQGLVGVLNGSLRSLVQVLHAYSESKS